MDCQPDGPFQDILENIDFGRRRAKFEACTRLNHPRWPYDSIRTSYLHFNNRSLILIAISTGYIHCI